MFERLAQMGPAGQSNTIIPYVTRINLRETQCVARNTMTIHPALCQFKSIGATAELTSAGAKYKMCIFRECSVDHLVFLLLFT